MDSLAAQEDRIGRIVSGRRWITVYGVAAAATEVVRRLVERGADDVILVAASPGVGAQPECDVIWTGAVAGRSIMEGFRAFDRVLAEPSEEVVSRLNDFDPDHTAWVAGDPFRIGTELFERRLYGARRPEWAALEDKILIGEVWREAGIETAPEAVVPVAAAASAAQTFENGNGTVWAIDNREGWHGGSEGTRWVGPGDAERAAAAEWAGAIADRVRIMPFLDGIPCSIHGFVTDTGVAVFRPIEMTTFRTADRRFRYGGLASTWEAPDWLRRQMRGVAAAVGARLDHRLGYRGAFSVDGVATASGFLPTEVNPRFSAGLEMQASVVPGLDLAWLSRALIEGDIRLDHAWLERTVLEAARSSRAGRMVLSLFEPVQPAETRVRFEGDTARPTEGGDGVATLSVGEGPSGTVVFLRFDEDRLPFGRRFAPYALAAARLASDLWEFELEELSIAPDRSRLQGASG